MSDNYIECHFSIPESEQEVLIAQLSLFGFDSFWQEPNQLIAYVKEEDYSLALLEQLKIKFGPDSFEIKRMESKNWNALWESHFEPVIVDNLCLVRAEFHKDDEDLKYTIVIRPKMAFGTAHHETTFMMLQTMLKNDFQNKRIADFGCGTGILSVLADQLGALKVIAFDHEAPSVENTLEHIELNQTNNVEVFNGGIDFMVEQKDLDIVLANINRSVLMTSRDHIYQALNNSGLLLMSGILLEDQKLILDHFSSHFSLNEKLERGEWTCFVFKKKDNLTRL